MQKKIMLLNGANLNMLGHREQNIYTNKTLTDIVNICKEEAQKNKAILNAFQSNIEGELVNYIQQAYFENYTDIIINAGAYSHTSIAIFDALSCLKANIYEVHLSNIYAREDFRHKSYISKIAKGVICGLQENGYLVAINHICKN
jgi:3-dehydroquinate dehydratase-2